MWPARFGSVDIVARLLEDPRVRANINRPNHCDATALHGASYSSEQKALAPQVRILLQAGADPTLMRDGETLLDVVRDCHPDYHDAIVLLEQALAEAEKAWLLVKARRLAVTANSNTVAPSCLQGRVARGQPLPRVVLAPLTGGENGEEEECRKFRTSLAFMCGLGREGMPRDVFRVVMDLLMLPGDPLPRKGAGTDPPAPQVSAKKRRRKKRKKKSTQEG